MAVDDTEQLPEGTLDAFAKLVDTRKALQQLQLLVGDATAFLRPNADISAAARAVAKVIVMALIQAPWDHA